MKCKFCNRKINNGFKFLCKNCLNFFIWRYGSFEKIEKILDQYLKERKSNYKKKSKHCQFCHIKLNEEMGDHLDSRSCARCE